MSVNPINLLKGTKPNELSGNGHSLAMELFLGRYPSQYNNALPVRLDWRHRVRNLKVKLETLDYTATILRETHAKVGEKNYRTLLLPILSMHLTNGSLLEQHEYPQSLVGSWAICEKLLASLWIKFLDKNKTRTIEGTTIDFIQGKRRKTLGGDHRTYSASVIIEILSLSNEIPIELYNSLNAARSARNHWLHNLAEVTGTQALAAYRTAQLMLKWTLDFSIEVPITRAI